MNTLKINVVGSKASRSDVFVLDNLKMACRGKSCASAEVELSQEDLAMSESHVGI